MHMRFDQYFQCLVRYEEQYNNAEYVFDLHFFVFFKDNIFPIYCSKYTRLTR